MILETVRLVAAWLERPVDGIAGRLALLPLDAGVVAPPAPVIRDETRHPDVAVDRVPPAAPGAPVVSVYAADGGPSVDLRQGYVRPLPADADVVLGVRVTVAQAADPTGAPDAPAAVRDVSCLLRASYASLARLVTVPGADASRTRAGVQLVSVTGMRFADLFAPAGDGQVTGALFVTLRVRDTFVMSSTP